MAELGQHNHIVFSFWVIYIEIIKNVNRDTLRRSQVPVQQTTKHLHFKKVKITVLAVLVLKEKYVVVFLIVANIMLVSQQEMLSFLLLF